MRNGFPGHRLSIACPHCGERASVRSSKQQTVLVRDCNMQCSNVECAHTFGAQLSITHTIAPSRVPNPDVVLPFAARARPLKPANDDQVEPPQAEPAALIATG